MSDLKLKAAALVVVIAIVTVSLGVSGTSLVYEDLPADINHDGIVNIKDALILRLSWMSVVGDTHFNVACDFNGDGIINIKDATVLGLSWMRCLRLKVQVSIMPCVLNLKCKGNWITCEVLLPEGFGVSDVDISSIRLNDTITAGSTHGICDASNGLIIKFSRQAVIALIGESFGSKTLTSCCRGLPVTLTVSGRLVSGRGFCGSDEIRVIHANVD